MPVAAAPEAGEPTILPRVEPDVWARLTLAPRVVSPAEPAAGHAVVAGGTPGRRRGDGGRGRERSSSAWSSPAVPTTRPGATSWRSASRRAGAGDGLATGLLATRLEWTRPGDVDHEALITVAERDPIEPLDVTTRVAIARRLLSGAGYAIAPAGGPIGAADRTAIRATRKDLRGADTE